jgi:nucleoid DNA-binding protein
MNKAELVEKYSKEMGCRESEADVVVNAVFRLVREALGKGKEVKISGLGTFKVVRRKARTGRNPQTGDAIKIPARKKLVLKASKSFTADLNA